MISKYWGTVVVLGQRGYFIRTVSSLTWYWMKCNEMLSIHHKNPGVLERNTVQVLWTMILKRVWFARLVFRLLSSTEPNAGTHPSRALKGQPTTAPAATPSMARLGRPWNQPVIATTVLYMQKVLGRNAADTRHGPKLFRAKVVSSSMMPPCMYLRPPLHTLLFKS